MKGCGCKSMRSGGKCMKCGGTAKYSLGGVIKYFADGGTVTAPGSGGGGAGGGGGQLSMSGGTAGQAGTTNGSMKAELDRIKAASTKEDMNSIYTELSAKYGDESPLTRAASYKNSILHADMTEGKTPASSIISGIQQNASGEEGAMLKYVLGQADDYMPTSVQGQGEGGAMGSGARTTGVEDKSLPNWGRAKTQQAVLNKLIEADKSADKPQMLKEDDVIGPKTLEVMKRYETMGTYKRPELFSETNLAQYKQNMEGAKTTTGSAPTKTTEVKPTEKKATPTGGYQGPSAVTNKKVDVKALNEKMAAKGVYGNTSKPTQKYGDITGALGGMGQGLGNIIEGVGAGLSTGFESMMDYASKYIGPSTTKEFQAGYSGSDTGASKDEEMYLQDVLNSMYERGQANLSKAEMELAQEIKEYQAGGKKGKRIEAYMKNKNK